MCSAEPVRLQPVVAGESGHHAGCVPEHTLREDGCHWYSPVGSQMGAAPGWITYDLNRPCFLTRIGFRGDHRTYCPRDVILQSSEAQDGPWTDVLPFTTRMTGDLQMFDVPMVVQACRYWRIHMNSNHGMRTPGDIKFILTEIRFFGVQQ